MPPSCQTECRALAGILLVVLVAICGCGSTDDPVTNPDPETDPRTLDNQTEPSMVIVAMGDSLTEGYNVPFESSYPSQLARMLNAAGHNVRVINAGISGETSSGARARVDWVLTLKPNIVILETGGNDGLRGVDPKVTAQNIRHIINAFKQRGVIVLLAGMQIVQNMGQQYVDAFRAIYPALAKDHDVTLIPFFLEGVAGNANLNQADAIHPTVEGYTIVAATVYPFVVSALQETTGDDSR